MAALQPPFERPVAWPGPGHDEVDTGGDDGGHQAGSLAATVLGDPGLEVDGVVLEGP